MIAKSKVRDFTTTRIYSFSYHPAYLFFPRFVFNSSTACSFKSVLLSENAQLLCVAVASQHLVCLVIVFLFYFSEFQYNVSNYHSVLKFPTDEDLNGAAVALMRLQDTYKLDTSAVARGLINGVQYSSALTGLHVKIIS